MSNFAQIPVPGSQRSKARSAAGRFARSLLLAGFIYAIGSAAVYAETPSKAPAQGAQRATAKYGKLPLSFEANQGQTDAQVKFISRGEGYSLFLTGNSALLKLANAGDPKAAPATVGMELLGASHDAHVTGTDQLPGIVNYFMGNDPAKWRSNIHTFAKVRYASVYPGVDAVFYGNRGSWSTTSSSLRGPTLAGSRSA